MLPLLHALNKKVNRYAATGEPLYFDISYRHIRHVYIIICIMSASLTFINESSCKFTDGMSIMMDPLFNTLRPEQNGRHFPDDIFKCIFLNANVWMLIKISLKFVSKGPINNIPALVQIMAWRRPGDKPLSGPMMVRLPTHICVTRPQWVNGHMVGTVILFLTQTLTKGGQPVSTHEKLLWIDVWWNALWDNLTPCSQLSQRF